MDDDTTGERDALRERVRKLEAVVRAARTCLAARAWGHSRETFYVRQDLANALADLDGRPRVHAMLGPLPPPELPRAVGVVAGLCKPPPKGGRR